MTRDIFAIIGFSAVTVLLLWWKLRTRSTMRQLRWLHGCDDVDAFVSELNVAVSADVQIRVMGLTFRELQTCFFVNDGLLLPIPPYGSVVIPYGDFTVRTRRHVLARLIELRVKDIAGMVIYLGTFYYPLVEGALTYGHLSDEMLIKLAGEQG